MGKGKGERDKGREERVGATWGRFLPAAEGGWTPQ